LLGELFPELAYLHCATSMSQYTGSSLRVAPLPRLTHLRLDRLGRFSQNFTTEELGVVLGAMFAACPNLETLSLQHGSMYPGSKKNPCTVMPLPAANDAFSALQGERLRSLTVTQIRLTDDVFDKCSFPLLGKVTYVIGARRWPMFGVSFGFPYFFSSYLGLCAMPIGPAAF
jgi:hypothetical protein